jgi:hypothetical protein
MVVCAFWSLLVQPTLCLADLVACACACPTRADEEQGDAPNGGTCDMHCCSGAVMFRSEARPRGEDLGGWDVPTSTFAATLSIELPMLTPDVPCGRWHPSFKSDLPFAPSDVPLLV